jgi:predicted phage terminase large subunit-like protein
MYFFDIDSSTETEPKIEVNMASIFDLVGRRARATLADFVRASWSVLEPATELEWGWVQQSVADQIQAVVQDAVQARSTKKRNRRHLAINVPPGTLKSRILTCAVPWAWLHWPWLKFLVVSGNPNVVSRDSEFTKKLIESDWYRTRCRPGFDLRSPDAQARDLADAKNRFQNSAGGERVGKTLASQVTGERADIILLDDPDDQARVWSDADRERRHNGWRAFASRSNDARSLAIVAAQQRVHAKDWTATFAKPSHDWDCLVIPLVSDPDLRDKYAPQQPPGFHDRRASGESIDPARFSAEIVALRKGQGSRNYAAWEQQAPVDEGSKFFQRRDIRWWRPAGAQARARPDGSDASPALECDGRWDQVILSVDAAFKAKADGSRVALLVLGRKGALWCVLHDSTDHIGFGETKRRLKQLVAQYRPHKVLVEDKANGSAIIDDLKTIVPGLVAIEPRGGKEARAAATQPVVEAWQLHVLEGAPWAGDFIDELCAFPNGTNDDRVDALSQALVDSSERSPVERLKALAR